MIKKIISIICVFSIFIFAIPAQRCMMPVFSGRCQGTWRHVSTVVVRHNFITRTVETWRCRLCGNVWELWR